MIAMLFVAVSLGLPPYSPAVPQAAPTELVLTISASPIYPDGKSRGYASTSASDESGYLFGGPSPCTAGGSVKEPGESFPTGIPGYGWRVSGRVLQRLDNDLLVEIQWQRLWEQSRRIDNGQKGSMQVSMHVGDRLPLDDIFVPLVAGCDAVGMHLEAVVSERVVRPPGAKMSGMVATTAAREVAAAAGGVGAKEGSTTIKFGPGVASAAEPVNVDLWLVHTLPNGTDEVQRVTTSASPSSQFRFPPITVNTSEGNATVEISGDVSAIVDVSGQKQLRVVIGRVVRDNPALNGVGHSISAHPMPKTGEVYSFETPALRSKGEPVKSDRVSLRLQVSQKGAE